MVRPVETSSEPAGKVIASHPRLVAVIDIGSTSTRMVIAQLGSDGSVDALESLHQSTNLGKDTFTSGSISQETTEECVRVLRSFREILQQYQVSEEGQIRAVATSAVREAANRDAFLDRIYIGSGINVELIDEAETNRITYLAVHSSIESRPALSLGDTLIVEVGGGNTEALLLRQGQVTYSHTYHLGSLRLREMLEDHGAPALKLPEIMEIHIDRAVEQVRRRLSLEKPPALLTLGGDVRFAASRLVTEWAGQPVVKLSVSALSRLTDEILELSLDDVVRRYHLPYPEAETLGPALQIYVRLAQAFGAKHLLVSNATLRDGLMLEMAARQSWSEELHKQVVHAALEVGRKYSFDEAHAKYVADMCGRLFAVLREQHRLSPRYELILTVAAWLHDIGLFVSNRSHHKHSMYLIQNSDLFGLGGLDTQMVALVARYHRRALPRPVHEGFTALDRERRIAVVKMAAILRVADALDTSHSGRVSNPDIRVTPEGLTIIARERIDLTLEKYSLQQKAQMFEQVYGMKVILRESSCHDVR